MRDAAKFVAFMTCKGGGLHNFSYLGAGPGEVDEHYACSKCGTIVTKRDLKEATD